MGYKYKVNHEYFDKIDTEYKAYILGFIYADGAVVQSKGKRQLKLVISIAEEDRYILEELSRDVAGGQLKIMNPPAISKKGWKKRAVLTVVSDKLCNALIKYGCNIRKSSVGMTFPDIEKCFIKDFIRGFMDGDGCIYKQKVKYSYIRKTDVVLKRNHSQKYKLRIAFTSTDKEFLNQISKELGIKNPYIKGKLRKQMVYTFWIESFKKVTDVIEFLYKDSNIYLTRKFNKTIKSQAEDISSEGLETT